MAMRLLGLNELTVPLEETGTLQPESSFSALFQLPKPLAVPIRKQEARDEPRARPHDFPAT